MAVKTMFNIVQETCYRINTPAPTTLNYKSAGATSNDFQWLHLLYEAGEWLRDNFDWPSLKRKYTFATVADQKIYPLPGDFWRLLLNTQWDDTNSWILFGPVNDGDIAARDKGTTLNDTQFSYRVAGAPFQTVDQTSFTVNGGYIEISPTPSDVRTLSMEYISGNWFYPPQWVTATAYTAGDYCSANGAIYKCTTDITASDTRPTGEAPSDDDGDWQLWRGLYNEISEQLVSGTPPTDYPILDPHTLSLALRMAWLRAKGKDFSVYEQSARDAANNAIGRFQGVQSIRSDGEQLYEFPWVSEDFVSTGW